MIFIVGGFAQGKLEYVLEKYSLSPDDVFDAVLYPADLSGKKVLYHAESLVEKWIRTGKCPEDEAYRICSENKDIIIISQDVGCGLVPIEKEKRILREKTGRVNCIFAEKADIVERVCCGIGIRIK